MRTTALISFALLAGAIASSASAQTANFDTQTEGTSSGVIFDGGLNFFDLDQAIPGQTSYVFSVDDASVDLAGFPNFTSPNTLGFGGFSPGTGVAFTRCKSFKIQPAAAASTASLELYVFDGAVGNSVTFEAWSAGSMVASNTTVFLGGFVVRHYQLTITAPSFDELRVVGSGPNELGTFFGVIDTVVVSSVSPGTIFCAGDGSGTACPCLNPSPVGSGDGCLNSFGQGGRLRGSGSPSIANDTLVLLGSQMPNAAVLYFQGTTPAAGGAGSVFGDGLRCAVGSVLRLGTKTNSGGASSYPEAGDASISVRGQITTPGTRYYQGWYRNNANFCTPSLFNLTNGWQVSWAL